MKTKTKYENEKRKGQGAFREGRLPVFMNIFSSQNQYYVVGKCCSLGEIW